MPVWRGEGDFLSLLKKSPRREEASSDAETKSSSTSAITSASRSIFKPCFGES